MINDLQSAKIQLLCKKQPSSLLLSGVGILLLVFPYIEVINLYFVTWMTISYLTLSLRAGLIVWYKNLINQSKTFRIQHELLYAGALFLHGSATTGILFLAESGSTSGTVYITYLFLLAILSGGISRTSSSRVCSNALIFGIMGTAAIVQFFQDPIAWFNVIAFGVYGVFVFITAKQNVHQFDYQFELIRERENHIQKLSKMIALEEELKEQKAMTHHLEKMASLGEMAGNIAHEINNPLTIIKGNVEILEKKMGRKGVEKHYDAVYSTVHRITEIIDNLKGFSRRSSEEPQTIVNLRKVIQEVIGLAGEKMRVKGIELHLHKIRPVMIQGKHSGLLQVLLNIVNNSIHAVEPLENREIHIEMDVSDKNCILKVRDSGPGVPKDIQNKIFAPYFSTKDPEQGTGLGLSICKKLIEDMGGDVYLSKDNSSEFHIILKKAVESRSTDKKDEKVS